MNTANLITLRIWGDFACFTRPEMKVERVSYPVLTPSAARGILEAVFWEPQMYYLIDSIRVVKRGRWISIRRNEVTRVISLDSAKTWMHSPDKVSPIHAGGGAEDGTQRNMLALQDVEYLITAEVRLTPLAQPPRDNLAKYLREIEGRARAGKCFHRPGLGMREFAADFDWEPDADAALARRTAELGPSAAPINEPLGLMLYDLFDHRARAAGFRWLTPDEEARQASDFDQTLLELKKGEQTKRRKEFGANRQRSTAAVIKPHPLFFQANLKNSRLDCHPDRVLGPIQGGN
ncbi:MAG: type I-C CRISPR-associated protein Cas5 [Opitutus sp.]|nr:type I-C CRISPR-associated protein Cas5 [Opitutus sp.]MCS6247501.1 type I-C CRISPR-associated protein Cas5 [Opitutus sp.]MCS6273881.1 type I-C CRISPR-associated protein Cas5 [Opitutus sp.]MCS6278233.1 type I-C CRISPR-associated protein Cas5 [Opitutus sp.]MCS6299343.1 type I-C CRISPR-associated protein Cas5 [Opitutus sp.]